MSQIELYGDTYDVICRHRYNQNQAPVLELFDSETGEIGGVISVCVPGVSLERDETAVITLDRIDLKAVLINAGIACDCGKQIVSPDYGYCEVVKVNTVRDS